MTAPDPYMRGTLVRYWPGVRGDMPTRYAHIISDGVVLHSTVARGGAELGNYSAHRLAPCPCRRDEAGA